MRAEAEITEGLKRGDGVAVEAAVNCFGDRLLRTALAITGDQQVAEEVVQDTFLQMCRKIHSFKGQSSLQTWIFRIAVNLARNRLRGGWFRRVVAWGEIDLNQLPAPPGGSPEAEAVARESREEVLGCLQALPAKYREVLVLYYLEELSVGDIGQVLEQPEGTVKSKLSRGRALLKAEIEAKWGITGGSA